MNIYCEYSKIMFILEFLVLTCINITYKQLKSYQKIQFTVFVGFQRIIVLYCI